MDGFCFLVDEILEYNCLCLQPALREGRRFLGLRPLGAWGHDLKYHFEVVGTVLSFGVPVLVPDLAHPSCHGDI
jgi:hypothetical protein